VQYPQKVLSSRSYICLFDEGGGMYAVVFMFTAPQKADWFFLKPGGQVFVSRLSIVRPRAPGSR
jgi:hypothetical protein